MVLEQRRAHYLESLRQLCAELGASEVAKHVVEDGRKRLDAYEALLGHCAQESTALAAAVVGVVRYGLMYPWEDNAMYAGKPVTYRGEQRYGATTYGRYLMKLFELVEPHDISGHQEELERFFKAHDAAQDPDPQSLTATWPTLPILNRFHPTAGTAVEATELTSSQCWNYDLTSTADARRFFNKIKSARSFAKARLINLSRGEEHYYSGYVYFDGDHDDGVAPTMKQTRSSRMPRHEEDFDAVAHRFMARWGLDTVYDRFEASVCTCMMYVENEVMHRKIAQLLDAGKGKGKVLSSDEEGAVPLVEDWDREILALYESYKIKQALLPLLGSIDGCLEEFCHRCYATAPRRRLFRSYLES